MVVEGLCFASHFECFLRDDPRDRWDGRPWRRGSPSHADDVRWPCASGRLLYSTAMARISSCNPMVWVFANVLAEGAAGTSSFSKVRASIDLRPFAVLGTHFFPPRPAADHCVLDDLEASELFGSTGLIARHRSASKARYEAQSHAMTCRMDRSGGTSFPILFRTVSCIATLSARAE